ncbi:CocE/NonD family hydrolase C-terminal non-catalytic domain-containing protein [Amycolatopsis jiangsuensis]|uniref:CocE/NonD family hydrolase C-terminal non-catalytic domain-containing protein n=1 Tax=Amycolatopsis jiangsuensis TaxID=1181879 RepID=UPI0035E4667B
MDSCAHRLPAGHRLRLQVSGGSHPCCLRNSGRTARHGDRTPALPGHHPASRLILPMSPQ